MGGTYISLFVLSITPSCSCPKHASRFTDRRDSTSDICNFLPDLNFKASFVSSSDDFPAPIPDKATRRTLLNAALACHAFTGPARDALWWAMDDLEPLFSLLPGFQREEIGGQDRLTISGPVLKGDCHRFFEYATRIRFYNIARPDNIHISAYTQVLRASHHTCLLPSLNYLRCIAHIAPLLFIIPPHLRAFFSQSNSIQSKPWNLYAFVDELVPIASNLVCLSLKTMVTDRILIAVGRMPHLKYLSLESELGDTFSITNGFFESLSASATLSYLHLSGIMDVDSWPSPSPVLLFPKLDTIELQPIVLPSVDRITNFLRGVKFPSLSKLKCWMTLPATREISKSEKISEFLKALGQSTDFKLKALDFGPYQGSYTPNFGPTLADLPTLANFELLDFRIPFLNSLSSGDVTFVINSWPDLQVLDLRSLQSQKLEFGEVVNIAEGLPGLRLLGMELLCQETLSAIDIPVLKHGLISQTPTSCCRIAHRRPSTLG
ncbi:hypothetical protein GALMADRAFT_778468 [Galerina marginata CBS 339.88]|uniref:F-box domain-containing protein n=1 Tax=Galerina marginata (strain CBS 339.88) TaxID=685588 RepID=A0A067SNY2_GALM3|nr:hypothetical protein GALMADRAFT_778468 [Galerina marginata CBS 339.88]